MAQMIIGSLNLTKLIAQAKKQHSAFTKSEKNGDIYVSILQWINDEPDKFKNDCSFQLNSTKEKKEQEEKVYIGNGKKLDYTNTTAPLSKSDISNFDDDLPF